MNRCQLLFQVPVLAIGLVMQIPETQATEAPLDGSWVTLIGPEVPSLPPPDSPSPYTFPGGPWTMSFTGMVKLTVTDWLAAGDLFQVYNYNILLGTGSSVPLSGAYATTPDQALGNPKFSQNTWFLPAGDYSLSFRSSKFAPTYSNGTIAFKVERVVPESGNTLYLLGVALAGIAGIRAIQCSEIGGRLSV